jgi:CHAD domain-containing protein
MSAPLAGADALPPPVPVSSHSTAGVAVMAHLRRQVGALLAADTGLDDDADDAVHQARVSARRLRSGLKVYGDLLRDGAADRLRSELSWYASRLSPSRDLEVFAALLESAASGRRADVFDESLDAEALAATVLPWIRDRRRRSHSDALVDLRSERADLLRRDLVRWATEPLFEKDAARPAGKVLAPRVLKADRRAAHRFEALTAASPPDAWHLARIAAKRARYAAEVGAPPLGRPSADLARLWTDVTEPLGDAQDAVVQRALVLDRVADPAAPLSAGEAFTCGLFVAATHDREVAARDSARDGWHASRARHRALRKALGA